MLSSSEKPAVKEIIEFISRRVSGRSMIIGVSGGIDSSVVYKLASIADTDRVRAFFLPDSSTPESDYQDVANLGGKGSPPITTIRIDAMVKAFTGPLGISDPKLLGNVKSRVRMVILYYYANLENGLVLGTTNRSEYMTGYFTKHGDGACDLEPIMHLYKSEVREMASALGIPEHIITKAPSAGLWEGQTDEEDLGFSYESLDSGLKCISDGNGDADPRIVELYRNSLHKRSLPASLLEGKI